MKKLFLVCILLVCTFFLGAQTTPVESFKISNNTNPEKADFYKSVILKSNFEEYRLRNTPVTLNFNNGFTLELFSAKELENKGNSVEASRYKESVPENYQYPLFKISDDGILVTMHHSPLTKQQIKENSAK